MARRTPADQDIQNWSKMLFSWRPLGAAGIEPQTFFFPNGVSYTYDIATPANASYTVTIPSPGPNYTLANLEYVTAVGVYHSNPVAAAYVTINASGNFVASFAAGHLVAALTSCGPTGAPANVGNTPPDERLMVMVMIKFKDTQAIFVPGTVVGPGADPTGGLITTNGGFRIHTFLASGDSFELFGTRTLDVLVIAGGGSGGHFGGGGGGAGGMRAVSGQVTMIGAYPVTVGLGGVGVPVNDKGLPGGNSIFDTITSLGGGGGGGNSIVADAGGSGGGASINAGLGVGTPGQGNDGGAGAANGGGGGGGAGAVGVNAPTGTGGAGLSNDFRGTGSVFYAGGGGGSRNSSAPAGAAAGGVGGGGSGDRETGPLIAPTSGTVNTGGGGGGAWHLNVALSGAGGSGIVVIRYPYPP